MDTTTPRFRPVQLDRAADHIARQIRQEITDGRLKPGSKLPAERALAAELGVSRNTLREAVRTLEHAGLLQLRKGAQGGIFVRADNSDAIAGGLLDLARLGGVTPQQLIDMLIWLQPVITREAYRAATPADMERLQRNLHAAEAAHEADDFEQKFLLNHEFHRMLARLSGNPLLMVFMDGMLQILEEFVVQIGRQETGYVLTARREFMQHFQRGETEQASAVMAQSLQRFLHNYLVGHAE